MLVHQLTGACFVIFFFINHNPIDKWNQHRSKSNKQFYSIIPFRLSGGLGEEGWEQSRCMIPQLFNWVKTLRKKSDSQSFRKDRNKLKIFFEAYWKCTRKKVQFTSHTHKILNKILTIKTDSIFLSHAKWIFFTLFQEKFHFRLMEIHK